MFTRRSKEVRPSIGQGQDKGQSLHRNLVLQAEASLRANKCPAYGVTCGNRKELHHYELMCRYPKKNIKGIKVENDDSQSMPQCTGI